MDELNSGKDTPNRPNGFNALSHILMVIGVFLVSMPLFSFIVLKLLGLNVSDLTSGDYLLEGGVGAMGLKWIAFFGSSLPMIFAAVLTTLIIKAKVKGFLLLSLPRNTKFFLLAIVFTAVAIPLMQPLFELNSWIDLSAFPKLNDWLQNQESANNQMYERMLGNGGFVAVFTSVLFMALLPALAEEFLFRGFLQNAFYGLFKNIHVSIVVTALLFSLLHMQFLKFLPMTFLAIAFGYAVYWTGSLWTSILVHFLNNAIVVMQLYFVTDGSYEQAFSEAQSLPWMAVVSLAVIAGLLFVYMNKNSTTKTENFYV